MQEQTPIPRQRFSVKIAVEEKVAVWGRRHVLQTFFHTFASSIEAGMQRENAEEFKYALADDREFANRQSLARLQKGFIGKHSPFLDLPLDGSLSAATMDTALSAAFGTVLPGSSLSQRDVFSHTDETPEETKQRRSRVIEAQWQFLDHFSDIHELSGLQMQVSSLLDRETGKYVVLVTRLRTAQRNMERERRETFLETTLYHRELVFGAVFDNPHDILQPGKGKFFQLTKMNEDRPKGWRKNVFRHSDRVALGQALCETLGNPKYPDVTTLGEHPFMQHFNHPMFVSSER